MKLKPKTEEVSIKKLIKVLVTAISFQNLFEFEKKKTTIQFVNYLF